MDNKNLADLILDPNSPERLKQVSDALGTTTEELTKLAEATNKAHKEQSALTSGWEASHKELAKIVKTLREHKTAARQTEDALSDLTDSYDDMKIQKDLLKGIFPDKSLQGTVSNLEDVEKELEALSKKLEEGLQLTADDLLKASELRKFKNRIKEATETAKASQARIEKAFGGGGLFGKKKGITEAFSQFKDARKDPERMQKWASGLKNSGMVEKTLGNGAVGKVASGALGKIAVGGLAAKAVPVAGWIYTALDAANTAITFLDDYRKKANQAYAGLAGPQMNGEDFGRKSKTYNKAIRNVDFNMEMGMDAEDWNAMFQSMRGAGVGVDQLSKSLGNQKDVMRSVRETGIALGMSTDIMGESYATMSMETKSGLQTIQDGFEDVARGAQKAGITTDKFYSTIQASVLAMGSYGNYTSVAASALEKLVNTAGMSNQDASAAANKATTGFKDMGAQDKLKYVGILDATRGGFDILSKAIEGELSSTKDKLKKPGLTDPERKSLEAKVWRLEQVKGSNDPTIRMNALNDVSGHKQQMDMQLLMEHVGGNAKGLVDNLQKTFDLFAGQVGMGDEVASMLKQEISGNMSQLGGVSSLNKAIKSDPMIADKLSSVLDVMDKGELMTPEDNAYVESQLTAIAKASGMTGNQVKGLLDTGKRTPKAFARAMRPGLENGQISSEEIAVGSASAIQDATDRWNKDQVRGQKKIIKELTPMQKLFDITRDSIFYNMSASDAAVGSAKALEGIKKSVYSIAGYLLGSEEDEGDAAKNAVEKTNEEVSSAMHNLVEFDKNAAFFAGKSAKDIAQAYTDESPEALGLAKSLGAASSAELKTKLGKDPAKVIAAARPAAAVSTAVGENMQAEKEMKEIRDGIIKSLIYSTSDAGFEDSVDPIQAQEKLAELSATGMSDAEINAALREYVKNKTPNNQVIPDLTKIRNYERGEGFFNWLSPDHPRLLEGEAPAFHSGGDVPAILRSGESVVTPEHKSSFMKFMDSTLSGGPSGRGSSNRTLSVGVMNITQPTDTNGIMNMFKRQEFNSMAS